VTQLVVSVEELDTTIAYNDSEVVVNLGKSQDVSMCVPFRTMTGGHPTVEQPAVSQLSAEMTASPDSVTLQRVTGTIQTVDSVTFIVEFDSDAVTLQQGTFSLSGTSATATPSSYTASATFVVFNYKNSATPDNVDCMVVRLVLTDSTTLTFTRQASDGQIDGFYYLVEAKSSEFTVQHFTQAFTGSTLTYDVAIPSAITVARSFVLGSQTCSEAESDSGSNFNYKIIDTDSVLMSRGNDSTHNGSGDCEMQVIQLAVGQLATDVQHVDLDIADSGEDDTTAISAVTVANTALVPGSLLGSYENDRNGSNGMGSSMAQFSIDSTVQISANRQDTLTWGNQKTEIQVLDFELAGAPAAGQPTMRRWGGIPHMNLGTRRSW